jgi:hypothetical protein
MLVFDGIFELFEDAFSPSVPTTDYDKTSTLCNYGAGVPRSRAFDALDLPRGQREYLNVLYLPNGAGWHLVTSQDPDFDPGFATDLPLHL